MCLFSFFHVLSNVFLEFRFTEMQIRTVIIHMLWGWTLNAIISVSSLLTLYIAGVLTSLLDKVFLKSNQEELHWDKDWRRAQRQSGTKSFVRGQLQTFLFLFLLIQRQSPQLTPTNICFLLTTGASTMIIIRTRLLPAKKEQKSKKKRWRCMFFGWLTKYVPYKCCWCVTTTLPILMEVDASPPPLLPPNAKSYK